MPTTETTETGLTAEPTRLRGEVIAGLLETYRNAVTFGDPVALRGAVKAPDVEPCIRRFVEMLLHDTTGYAATLREVLRLQERLSDAETINEGGKIVTDLLKRERDALQARVTELETENARLKAELEAVGTPGHPVNVRNGETAVQFRIRDLPRLKPRVRLDDVTDDGIREDEPEGGQ